VFSYVLIFVVQHIPGLVQAWLGLFGVLGGPVLGLFSLGMFVPRADCAGALAGGIVSLVFMLWVSGMSMTINQMRATLVYTFSHRMSIAQFKYTV
jgi:sodium-coupled monocarboxylate transporter 8/12